MSQAHSKTSAFNKGANLHVLGKLVDHLRTANKHGTLQVDENYAGLATGLESVQRTFSSVEAAQGAMEAANASLESQLRAACVSVSTATGDSSLDWDKLDKAQRRAATLVLGALSDPATYYERFNSVGLEDNTAYAHINAGSQGQHDYRSVPLDLQKLTGKTFFDPSVHAYGNGTNASLESYDARNLERDIMYSVGYVIGAAKQLAFGDMFFPTITMAPDNNGIELSITQTLVQNDFQLNPTGVLEDRKQRNLVEAIMDATLLKDDSTRAYPVYTAGTPENEQFFALDIPAKTIEVQGETFLTRPILKDKKYSALAISQTPALIQKGIFDASDVIDHRVQLETIYVKVTTGTAPSQVTSIIPIKVENMAFGLFHKSAEGLDRQLVLNFMTKDITITADTKDVNGNQPAALAALFADPLNAKRRVRLDCRVSGHSNLEFNEMEVSGRPLMFVDLLTQTAEGVPYTRETDGAALTAWKAAFSNVEFYAYDMKLYRANLNRRQRGLMVTRQSLRERHIIQLGQPIYCLVPITDTQTLVDTDAPIQAVRARNENNAVTKLLSYIDDLSAIARDTTLDIAAPQVAGIGRYIMRPYIEQREIDLLDYVQSLNSAGRTEDVRSALVNIMRDMITRADYASGYSAALDMACQGVGERPDVLVGMDPIVANYVMVHGDTRTLAIGYDMQFATTIDRRMRNKIIMTFRRKNSYESDPLSSGNFYYIPELVTALPMARNNAISREIMVQPRTLHLIHLPLMMVIDIKNLSSVVTDRLSFPTEIA